MIHYLNMVMVSPIKTRHMEKLLLVDIGGTNMRHAVITDKSNEISNISKSPFIGNTFDIQLEELLKKDNIKTLIISVAGPKIKNTITMTNRDYTFDANEIKEKFSLKNCYLLNDWEAIAHSYSFISNNIESLKQGKSFNNNILFLGPGTGLGAALSIDNKIVIPTEIGNTSNSSSRLHQNYNIEIEKDTSLENVLSGSAISAIYKKKIGIDLSSEDIFKKFLEKDQIAEEVINGFIKSLADVLSDLSLTFIPGDGVLLAGSLIRTIHPFINKEDFKKRFIGNKKGAHKNILEMISIGVITKERTPLYGNLGFYKKLT